MTKFKTKGELKILKFERLELEVSPGDYGILDEKNIYHIIEGEFLYCGLAIKGKLLVTTAQINMLIFSAVSIFRVAGYFLHVVPEEQSSLQLLSLEVKYLSTENFDDKLEDNISVFQLDKSAIGRLYN